jgi:hypothetical protein
MFDTPTPSRLARRGFLRLSGLGLAAVGLTMHDLASAQAMAQGMGATLASGGTVDLGAGDTGVLNYAFALEQLEAAFYSQVVEQPFAGITSTERELLADIRDHEIAHREFFRAALGRNRIPDLAVNFSAIDFGSRQSVLGTAMVFEDLGVAAYNGGGAAIQNPDYLLLAGKIVSVEARHAAIIRSLINPGDGSFAGADVVNPLGLDRALPPSEVLPQAAPFIATPISAASLP